MPLEKMLAFADPGATDVRLTDGDRDLIDHLALPLDAAVASAKRDRNRPCALQDRQMAITAEGDVMLCCTVFDQSKYKLARFLDTPLAELQDMKYRHATCDTCMKNGLHVLFTYGSEDLDGLALERVRRHHPDARLKGMKQLQSERRPRGVRGWPRKIREHYGRVGVATRNRRLTDAGAAQIPPVYTGSRTSALRPPVGASPRTISPPWPRTTSRAMVRPRPTPPVSRLREASSR